VAVRDLFVTTATIVTAAVRHGRLLWWVHDGERFLREDGSVVVRGPLRPGLRFEALPVETVVAGRGRLVRVPLGGVGTREPSAVDDGPAGPAVAAADDGIVWIDGGLLYRDGEAGPDLIGEVLPRQTRLWMGPTFGLGFARAGGLALGFVFSRRGGGLDDSLALPPLAGAGKLRHAECWFAEARCWLLTEVERGGRAVRTLTVVQRTGRVEAVIESDGAAPDWLAPGRGRVATGDCLLVGGDDGLTRLAVRDGHVIVDTVFSETGPFVNAGSGLLAHRDGLIVVTERSLRLLRVESVAAKRRS
jgi:hypothetical protein